MKNKFKIIVIGLIVFLVILLAFLTNYSLEQQKLNDEKLAAMIKTCESNDPLLNDNLLPPWKNSTHSFNIYDCEFTLLATSP